jgi:hypothetical protein
MQTQTIERARVKTPTSAAGVVGYLGGACLATS